MRNKATVATSNGFEDFIEGPPKRRNTIGASKNTRKFISFAHLRNASTENVLNDFIGLLISQTNTTIAESVLRAFKGLLIISIGRKTRPLGAFRLRLGFDILDVSVLQALHAIAESLDSKTIGVSLSGLSKIVLLARPKFSNTSVTLFGILDSLNLGKLGVDLVNLSLKTLRKSVRLSGRTNEIKEAVSILDTFSLCDSLQTLGISIFGLCPNVFSLNTLQSGFTERRGTRHNVRHRVILIRTLRGNRTTVGL